MSSISRFCGSIVLLGAGKEGARNRAMVWGPDSVSESYYVKYVQEYRVDKDYLHAYRGASLSFIGNVCRMTALCRTIS